jgi:hypothetical protein
VIITARTEWLLPFRCHGYRCSVFPLRERVLFCRRYYGACSKRTLGYRELELAVFAVWQLAKMTRDFRESYQKRWHGELVGVS